MYVFPKGYFESEYREGFLVDSMVKRAWAAQLEVLSLIDKICDKYNLQYFAFWGTLLGAIRHKGYIPWDDDLDIIMKRQDYMVFIDVAKKELPEKFVVMSPYTEVEWCEQIARVTNSHSISFTNEHLKQYHGFPYATGVDIFPYDYISDSEEVQQQQDVLMDMVVRVREKVIKRSELISNNAYDNSLDNQITDGLNQLESIFGFEFNREIYLDNQLLCLYDQIAASLGNENDKYMTCFAERTKRKLNGSEFKIPSYWLDEAIDYPFEGYTIKVPKYYELCLSICYGKGFMTPIKSGVAGHDYPFFKDQVEILKQLGRYDEVMDAVKKSESMEIYSDNIVAYISDNTDVDNKIAFEKETDDNRKTILCCISEMDFYDNEEECINKLERIMSTFSESKDRINVVLAKAKNVEVVLEHKNSELVDKYYQALNKFKNVGEIIEPDEIEKYVDVCEAYYGSGNEYVKFFTDKMKPVMVCNVNV